MSNNGPRDEVFTTVLVNEAGEVADWDAHQQRLDCLLYTSDAADE